MLTSDFDVLWKAEPFKPFFVRTAGGDEILVKSPEFCWHAPANRIVWIAEGSGEARVRMIDLQLVTTLTVPGATDLPSTDAEEI